MEYNKIIVNMIDKKTYRKKLLLRFIKENKCLVKLNKGIIKTNKYGWNINDEEFYNPYFFNNNLLWRRTEDGFNFWKEIHIKYLMMLALAYKNKDNNLHRHFLKKVNEYLFPIESKLYLTPNVDELKKAYSNMFMQK